MRRAADPRELLPLTPAVLHILLALADGRRNAEQEDGVGRHGYAVAQEVEEMTEGQIRMGPGTLYGSIQRMLTSGLIEEVARARSTARSTSSGSEEDERRRYYRLTDLGFRVATAEAQRLEQMVRSARAKKLLPRTKSG